MKPSDTPKNCPQKLLIIPTVFSPSSFCFVKQTVFDPSFTLWSYELLFCFVLCHIYFSHIFLDFYLPFLFGVLFPFFWELLFPFSLWTFISILLFSLWTFIQSGSHFGFLPNFYSEISSSLNLSNFAGWKNSLEFLWCRFNSIPLRSTPSLILGPATNANFLKVFSFFATLLAAQYY